ncbi:hypothetical protein [Flavobacterium sp. LAR06]|uniref:hypothetical protein n=1 Tax=Flavobacterium sp. LAR06 TaxID=3064897 RepID=UPI0035C1545E
MVKKNLLLLLIISFSAKSQDLAEKIVISKITYVNQFDDTDKEFKTERKVIKNQKAIKNLLLELQKVDDTTQLLSKFKIDTNYIKNNPEKLLSLYNSEPEIAWNQEQKEYIFKVLKNIDLYKKQLNEYLSNGCCYGMHNSYRNQFVIEIFQNTQSKKTFKSRKYVWSYAMPFENDNKDLIYNFEIEKILNEVFNTKSKIQKPLEGNELLKYLVNNIIRNNDDALYKLSAYTYSKEINELKSDFNILSFGEMYAFGRYIGHGTKTFKIKLKNAKMLPNVYLQFLVTKQGNSLYSRDSIKSDYEEIVKRVQSIKFIRENLENNPNLKLDIYYTNNNAVNAYNIDGVNKNPTEWKKQDDYVKSLNWYAVNDIKPTFDISEAIKTSEKNHCGCNYRFDQKFIEKTIFFELNDEQSTDNSVWFLLPDNRVLLYILEGEKVLNHDYSEFGKFSGIQFPCVLFNENGEITNRKL